MNRDLSPAELNQLELLLDATSLNALLQGLSEVCGLKATHIAENWQDAALAKDWRTAEGLLGVTAVDKRIVNL